MWVGCFSGIQLSLSIKCEAAVASPRSMPPQMLSVKSNDCIILIYAMNLNAFDLNLLKVLDALLREGSTVRAGERIGLSQPAVSAALGRLRV
jgi:Bacterial regulatory helix-turn-helix protein, lysR family